MRFLLLLPLLGLLTPAARAEEKTNEDIVKAVRAALSAKRIGQRDDLFEQILERKDLDWPSVRQGLKEGPYYQKPLVTAYGARASKKHFGLELPADQGEPRGFSLYVPKKYDAKTPIPVLFYLHHSPGIQNVALGAEKAGVARFKFKKMCEKHGILFVAPYTSQGAEWWTPEGRRLVEWTLLNVKRLYNIDEDRVGLMGALGGADAVWYLGQELPGTWSVLMPMTGDPYEITGMIRPLFLGTLDRMDILMGVPGKTQSHVGEKNANQFLAGLGPMFGQRMRITAAIYPTAQGDFHYLTQIQEQVASFLLDRKRKPLADEVDVDTDDENGLRSLWLRNDGQDKDGVTPPGRFNFHSTRLKWTPPERKEPERRLGVQLQERPKWEVGMVITGTPGAAKHAKIYPRDILLEVDGEPVRKAADVKKQLEKRKWGEEAHLLIAREVRESELERARKAEETYKKVRARMEELRKAGKPIPKDLGAEIEDEEADQETEEEDDDEGGIEIGDGSDDDAKDDDKGAAGGAKPEKEKTHILVVERWVKLRRPAGPIVRRGFGAAMDRAHRKVGVRIGRVVPGSLAARSGLRAGDVIVQAGDQEIKKAHDLEAYFKDFKFEKEPEGERFVEFTVRRQNDQGEWGPDRTVAVRWEPVQSSRVDAEWNKKENSLRVLAHKASGFTLYFADGLIEPGKPFHLFINEVPYQDLVDPASAPEYPHIEHGSDPMLGDRLYRMRRKRAKVDGWKPDIAFAIEHYREHRDRQLLFGAKMTVDLTKMKEGFQKSGKRRTGRRGKKGERVKKAYDEYREKAQG